MSKISSKCSCGSAKTYATSDTVCSGVCSWCWVCSSETCKNWGCDAKFGLSVNTLSNGPNSSIRDVYKNVADTPTVGTAADDWLSSKYSSINIDTWSSDVMPYENKNTVVCRIHRLNKDNPLPVKAHESDAGHDVFASKTIEFGLGEIKLVPLGIIAEAPKGYHFKLFIRSSIPYKRGFTLANSVGIIDSEYCGPNDEWKMLLRSPYQNTRYDHKKHTIKEGERIGQLILEKNLSIEWEEQETAYFAEDSRGGFGSSGK